MNLDLYEFYKTYYLVKNYKGNGTELISLYIPSKKVNYEVIQKLKQQQSQAENIKLKHTRKIVQKGLETIISYLKQHQIGQNGLVIFCHDDKLFVLKPLLTNLKYSYSCGDTFSIKDLTSLINVSDKVYGLVTLDTNEACFATLNNENLSIIKEFESYIPGKTKKGGQSARRYAEIRKNETLEFFKKISESINSTLLPVLDKVVKIFVGGITPTLEQYIEIHPDLDVRLTKKLSEPYHVSYTNRIGIKFLLKLIQPELEDDKYARQIELFDLINRSKIIVDTDTLYQTYNISDLIITDSYLQPEEGFLKRLLINNPQSKFEIISTDTNIGKNIQSLYNGLVAIIK